MANQGCRLPYGLRAAWIVTWLSCAWGTFTSASEIQVRASQLGYPPNQPKIAMAFSDSPLPETFRVAEAETETTVFEGRTQVVAGTWGSFTQHAELDFSPLQRTGRFQLVVGRAAIAPVPDRCGRFCVAAR